mmetsp:Transcript_31285/g.35012  ORF Transcript_31285/g.35012 Transcript_31285/m.35012 type:complete len:81 (+) Transcript_31285:148-390(+)
MLEKPLRQRGKINKKRNYHKNYLSFPCLKKHNNYIVGHFSRRNSNRTGRSRSARRRSSSRVSTFCPRHFQKLHLNQKCPW